MIGFLNTEGIIPFIAPKKIAIVVPTLLTLSELINRTTVVATIPTPAAADPSPDSVIAKAIPTVETGVTIITANAMAIIIVIGNGCKSVANCTIFPSQVVTSPT